MVPKKGLFKYVFIKFSKYIYYIKLMFILNFYLIFIYIYINRMNVHYVDSIFNYLNYIEFIIINSTLFNYMILTIFYC